MIKATESKVAGGEEQEEVIGTSMSEDECSLVYRKSSHHVLRRR